jgi:uncharacterized membrane protein YdfJ with MMPL/SSD domain
MMMMMMMIFIFFVVVLVVLIVIVLVVVLVFVSWPSLRLLVVAESLVPLNHSTESYRVAGRGQTDKQTNKQTNKQTDKQTDAGLTLKRRKTVPNGQ